MSYPWIKDSSQIGGPSGYLAITSTNGIYLAPGTTNISGASGQDLNISVNGLTDNIKLLTNGGSVNIDSSGNISANSFNGPLNGTATSASTATSITIASTGSTDTTSYPVFVSANSATSQAPNTKSTLVFDASTGALSATSFSGSGSGLSASSIPPTSIDSIRFYASRGDSPQKIVDGGNNPILFTNVIENNGGFLNNTSTGVIDVVTDGTYSITVTGTWSGFNGSVAYGVTLMGGIRILTSTGFTYMGVTAYDGTNYISTVTAVLKLTSQTFRVFGYNITGDLLTFDPLIEIVRLTGA